MARLFIIFLFFTISVFANPLITDVINEFQTDTILGQKFEFHPINYGWEIPLFGTMVYTPGCSAYVDTNISNPPYGFTVIDTSVLNGTFNLNPGSGYLSVYKSDYFIDEIFYSDTFHSPILSPPSGASASRFIFRISSNIYPEIDWYIDSTPTLGSENDDYPGCVISGYVYLNNTPLENARVTASAIDSIFTQGPFYKECTTFTNSYGFYSFDSLWAVRYWMTASFGNHPPIGELSPRLCALWPTNFDFHLVGKEEELSSNLSSKNALKVYPNPFRDHLIIKFASAKQSGGHGPKSEIPLRVYDASGRVVKDFSRLTVIPILIRDQRSMVVWSGDDDFGRRLPSGVYFVSMETEDFKNVEKAILMR